MARWLVLGISFAAVVQVLCDEGYNHLKVIPKAKSPDEQEKAVEKFVARHMEPRHAVAVVHVGNGTKRHKLIQEVVSSGQVQYLLEAGVVFSKGPTSIEMRYYQEPPIRYEGKWTRSALTEWFKDYAYPLVNDINMQFASNKYMDNNKYGLVMIMKNKTQDVGLLKYALTPHATEWRHKLKFTFFFKDDYTKHICEHYGARTDDEILIIEDTQFTGKKVSKHSYIPGPPIYRMPQLTAPRINDFFARYRDNKWPVFYKSKHEPLTAPLFSDGIRVLTGWDYLDTVSNPDNAVLVYYHSPDCNHCDEFSTHFKEIADKLHVVQAGARAANNTKSHWLSLVLAKLDLSTEEQAEAVHGTPWMKYYPRGRFKKKLGMDVESRNADGIWNFLEDSGVEETGEQDASKAASKPKAASKAAKRKQGEL